MKPSSSSAGIRSIVGRPSWGTATDLSLPSPQLRPDALDPNLALQLSDTPSSLGLQILPDLPSFVLLTLCPRLDDRRGLLHGAPMGASARRRGISRAPGGRRHRGIYSVSGRSRWASWVSAGIRGERFDPLWRHRASIPTAQAALARAVGRGAGTEPDRETTDNMNDTSRGGNPIPNAPPPGWCPWPRPSAHLLAGAWLSRL
jgi:hypothetical protein